MKTIFRNSWCALLLAVFFTTSCAAVDLAGSRGWFSNKGLGARAIAMGEAFCAVADDASCVYWNPAGLVAFPSSQVTTMHSDIYGLGIMHDYVAWKGEKFGLLWEGANYQQLAGFPCREDSISLTFAKTWNLQRPIYWGVNLKGFSVMVDSPASKGTMQGIGLDLGLLAQLNNKTWLGFVVRDPVSYLKGEAQVADESWQLGEPLATEMNLGVSIRKDPRTLIAFECADLLNRPQARIGAERWLSNSFAIRGGWNAADGLSGGVGIKFSNWTFDYTYVSASLGASQKLAVTYSF